MAIGGAVLDHGIASPGQGRSVLAHPKFATSFLDYKPAFGIFNHWNDLLRAIDGQ